MEIVDNTASVGSRKTILPAVKTNGSLLFNIILNRTTPNPQHRVVPKLARTPISEEFELWFWSIALFATSQTPRIIAVVPRIMGKVMSSSSIRTLRKITRIEYE